MSRTISASDAATSCCARAHSSADIKGWASRSVAGGRALGSSSPAVHSMAALTAASSASSPANCSSS